MSTPANIDFLVSGDAVIDRGMTDCKRWPARPRRASCSLGGVAPPYRSNWGCGLRSALETTDFYVYIASGTAAPIASMVVGTEEGHSDYFRADKPGSSS